MVGKLSSQFPHLRQRKPLDELSAGQHRAHLMLVFGRHPHVGPRMDDLDLDVMPEVRQVAVQQQRRYRVAEP